MLNAELQARLAAHGIEASSETALREAMEAHVETYTLSRLGPWPARRWKCLYRLMTREQMYDGQSVEDVYALALLARLDASST